MDLYFSQRFDVEPELLVEHGAFNISVASDLPLFVDPFLLFNSEKDDYQELHREILRYLGFLRDKALPDLEEGLIDDWYRFKEVRQNWLGFTVFGNEGAGLGTEFAFSLHEALSDILSGFGEETITQGSHLEKLCLIKPGVGKDNISDFTTNLIKSYLLDYTEAFAREHLREEHCETFQVARAAFNYETQTWATKPYYLPRLDEPAGKVGQKDYVLLTPFDMLTRDETWISHSDMIANFYLLPEALPNEQQREQVNRYLRDQLGRRPSAKERVEAALRTVQQFPELLDYYIRLKEDSGDQAEAVSTARVEDTEQVLVRQVSRAIGDLEERTAFYELPWSTYKECLERVHFFKSYIEDNDGYKLLNRGDGEAFSKEAEVHLAFGLVWCKTELDVNREPNNGRGPVDFKASYGSSAKSLIEFKLASNTRLKQNLEKQVKIYERANGTRSSVKVIVYYTSAQEARVNRILKELKLEEEESVVVIDARGDNKPSASTA
ncbi:MAG: hypothetical protein ACRDLL_00030 [Solirubrobacterales bacterium]